jgi:hypothetical protein
LILKRTSVGSDQALGNVVGRAAVKFAGASTALALRISFL